MAEKPPLSREEVERVLARLEPLTAERRIILIGGQAVALWSAFFKLPEAEDDQRIYTSRDIDFEGAARSARRAGDLLGGRVRIPEMDHVTPNTGIVLFEDEEGVTREIDFLGEPGGLSGRDVRDTAVRIVVETKEGSDVPVLVMHPERCMESRIFNVMELRRRGTIAMDQLGRSVICAREYSRYLLHADGLTKIERVRAVLKLNERIFKRCLSDRRFRNVYLEFDVDPFDAVIADPALLKEFLERRHPQMVEKLEERRKRDRAHRRRHAHTRKKST